MAKPTTKAVVQFTKEQLEELTEIYTDREIAAKFNVWVSQVQRTRKKFGILSRLEKTGLIRVNGELITKSEQAKRRLNELQQIAWEATRGRPNPKCRLHSLNENFFESIDSEAKAYILGFIIADGCLYKNLHTVSIAIIQSDRQILEDIALSVGYTGEVRFLPRKEGDGYGGDDRVRLRLNSVKMVQDLKKLGLTPSKSFTARLPSIPQELEHHLIRGLWDGDGHIGKSMSCLVGNLELLVDVTKCFKRHQLPIPVIEPLKSIFRLRLIKSQRSILDWCYGCNPTIVLQRKYANYLVF